MCYSFFAVASKKLELIYGTIDSESLYPPYPPQQMWRIGEAIVIHGPMSSFANITEAPGLCSPAMWIRYFYT